MIYNFFRRIVDVVVLLYFFYRVLFMLFTLLVY